MAFWFLCLVLVLHHSSRVYANDEGELTSLLVLVLICSSLADISLIFMGNRFFFCYSSKGDYMFTFFCFGVFKVMFLV